MANFPKVFEDIVNDILTWDLTYKHLSPIHDFLDRTQKQELIDLLDQDPRYYQDRNNDYVNVNDALKNELHGKPKFVLWKNPVDDNYFTDL